MEDKSRVTSYISLWNLFHPNFYFNGHNFYKKIKFILLSQKHIQINIMGFLLFYWMKGQSLKEKTNKLFSSRWFIKSDKPQNYIGWITYWLKPFFARSSWLLNKYASLWFLHLIVYETLFCEQISFHNITRIHYINIFDHLRDINFNMFETQSCRKPQSFKNSPQLS